MTAALKPAYNERIQWSPNATPRGGVRNRLGVGHTQEGNGTAASLANYLCQSSSGVSYHYTLDNDRNVVAVVDTDWYSWSVLSANPFTINYCFAGSRAAWTRQQWLDNMGNAIEILAWLWVEDAKKYGLQPWCISNADVGAGKQGFTDHAGITYGLGIGNHTDLGRDFPFDVLAGHIDRFVNGVSEPVPDITAIEYCRAANEWLGSKVTTNREETAPDGVGKFVHYERGSIYWQPDMPDGKAIAVPAEIFAKWSSENWEVGYLGYPRGPHLVLPPYNRSDGTPVPGGTVQSFQGGTVYVSELGPYGVRGLIRDRYASLGYETKSLGWPTGDEEPWGDAKYGGMFQSFAHGYIIWINDGNSTIAFNKENKILLPIENQAPPGPAEPQPVGYVATPEENRATPVDGMIGGCSHFANPDDASTRGKFMGLSGEPADKPTDQWYAAMRFNYCRIQDDPKNPFWVKPVSGTSDLELKRYLPNRRLKVTNLANGKAVVVRPADWGPGAWAKPGGEKYRVVDLSATALSKIGASTDDKVVVEWVDPATPLGPIA